MKNIISVLILILLISLLSSCEKQDHSAKINLLIDKYIEAWNTGNSALFKDVVDSSFELRKLPDFKPLKGIKHLEEYLANTRAVLPDFFLKETKRTFLGDTAVVASWTFTATFKGENNLPPTGSKIDIPGFSIIYFNDNKLTGEWIVFSDLTWVKQLGYTITPPAIK